ncbi:Kelch repeat-containing protein [Candidatus Viridilinea mediisalina]|uniref:HTH luxR-type domain-containing protein n=1 Tax=Candidatus Viridilinea mediisalina TaxID=2024553 RepID=A0A2A6RLZ7_9CHLR|nr:kelch repeat-containing protein [Candidatus Viridilinea mediisalina]PDW03898.1 hypothetical protein CJ255_06505 [Candidatus Viridilinea mediisalina]
MTNDVQISEREREILELVVTGATNQQIALQLNISINTVKVHLRNIFTKIGVVSRTEATAYALRHGLVALHNGAATKLIAEASETKAAPTELVSAPHEPDAPPVPPEARADATEPAVEATTGASAQAEPADLAAHAEPASVVPSQPEAPNQTSVAPMPQRTNRITTEFRTWLPFIIVFGVIAFFLVALPLLRQQTATGPQLGDAPDVVASTASSRWTSRAPVPNPRDHFALAAFDLQREIYLFGGSDAQGVSASIERYDLTNDLWTSLGEKPTPVQHAQAATLRGQIFLPGGEDADGQVRDILEIYDPRERQWREGPALPAPRSRYTLVAWDGQIYLMGGWDGSALRDEVFIFDPDANRWLEGPTLPSPRQHAGSIIVSGRLYLIGGEGANGPLRESMRLDPGDNTLRRWISIAPLPEPSAAPVVIAPAGTLLVFDPLQQAGFQYNQTSDVWQPFSIPDEVNLTTSAVMLDAHAYFIAGADAPQPGAVYQYQTVFTIFLP